MARSTAPEASSPRSAVLSFGKCIVVVTVLTASGLSPAFSTSASSAPASRQRRRSRRAGRRWRHKSSDCGEVGRELASLPLAPDGDHDASGGLGHAARFSERADRIGGVLERVEAGDDVETRLGEGQRFAVAQSDVAAGAAVPGDLGKARRVVKAAGGHAARPGDLQRKPRAAADIDAAEPRLTPLRECGLVERAERTFLKLSPFAGPGAPEIALQFR